MRLTRKVHIKFEDWQSHDSVMSQGTFVYIQSVISMHCFSSFSRVTTVSGDNGNFPEYQIKCYDFEPLAATDTTESSSNSAHSELFNNGSSLRSFYFLT